MTLRTTLARLAPASALRHAARTALAATLTALLTRLLDLEQGYWAIFSAIIVMQANFGSSLMAGWARLAGTAAGALLGALAASGADALLGQHAAALPLAMFATIFLCALLAARNENLRLAGLTAAVVISLHSAGGGGAFELGLNRFLEVGLGVVVALMVSLAWPSRARAVLRFGLAKGLDQLGGLVSALMDSRLSGRYQRQRVFHLKDSVLRLSLRNRELLSQSRREPGRGGETEFLTALLDLQARLAEHLLAMDHAIENAPAEGFHRHLNDELQALGAALSGGLTALAECLRRPVREWTPPDAPFARLDAALLRAGEKLLALRKQRAIAVYDLDEVMHFYAFYNALREGALCAQDMARLAPPL